MNVKKLYGKTDLIGIMLSLWRNNNVLPLVRGKLIDIACGDNRLVEKYKNGIGVDIFGYGDNKVLILKDLSELPFKNKSFDTATAVASLNYFDNPGSVLKEIHRVLKDDGRLIFTMPNYSAIKIWDKFRPLNAHSLRYSENTIKKLLEEAGFTIAELYYFMFHLNTTYIAVKI